MEIYEPNNFLVTIVFFIFAWRIKLSLIKKPAMTCKSVHGGLCSFSDDAER